MKATSGLYGTVAVVVLLFLAASLALPWAEGTREDKTVVSDTLWKRCETPPASGGKSACTATAKTAEAIAMEGLGVAQTFFALVGFILLLAGARGGALASMMFLSAASGTALLVLANAHKKLFDYNKQVTYSYGYWSSLVAAVVALLLGFFSWSAAPNDSGVGSMSADVRSQLQAIRSKYAVPVR